MNNFGSYKEIKEHNIEFIRCDEITKPQELKEYNVVHPSPTIIEGLRGDAREDIVGEVITLGKIHKDKTFIIICDQGEHSNLRLPPNVYCFNRRFFMGGYKFSGDPPPEPKPDKTKWIYGVMGRADFMRTYWFDLLVEHGLHHKGNVSYLCNHKGDEFGGLKGDPDRLYLATGGTTNKNLLPYNNFEKEEKSLDERMKPNWIHMKECLFGISFENSAVEPTAWLSERTFQILAAGMVPVVIAGQRAMGELENLGFVVPDYIDWRRTDMWTVDYGNGIDKMRVIASGLSDFIKNHNLRDIADDWYPYAVKNHQHYQDKLVWYHKKEEQDVCRYILTITGQLNKRKYQKLIKDREDQTS